MTMRATVQKDAATARDAYGGKLPADWQPKATVPCFAWSKVREEQIDAERSVVMQHARMMLPLDAAVVETDRVLEVRDRIGALLFAGPFDIRGLERRVTHVEASLRLATA